jgi:hypothetical protein
MDGYKQYVRTDTNGIVILGFTSAFPEIATVQAGDLLLTGQDGRHFQMQLTNDKGQYLYKVVSGQMVQRTQAELDTEWSARPIPPDADAELTLAITNATTLDELKKALTGTNGKLAKVAGKMK